MKKITFREKCDFRRNKREKIYNLTHYVNFFKNVSLNVAEFSTFQKEKIYLRT